MKIRRRFLRGAFGWIIAGSVGIVALPASGAERLYLVDSQFSPPVTRIYEVNPASAALLLKAELGQTYTPVFGMAAADARTLYLTGTDTSPANACLGLTSCLLLKVELDPASTTPSQLQIVGILTEGGNIVGGVTGLTFRRDGWLYGISQETDSLYRIDSATAQATLVGGAGLDLHGGDLTFDDQDRLWAWSNIGAGDGLYQLDPATGQASAYELHPFLDFAGMAALMHGEVLYGTNPASDRLYALDLVQGLNGGVVMTVGGVRPATISIPAPGTPAIRIAASFEP